MQFIAELLQQRHEALIQAITAAEDARGALQEVHGVYAMMCAGALRSNGALLHDPTPGMPIYRVTGLGAVETEAWDPRSAMHMESLSEGKVFMYTQTGYMLAQESVVMS